MLSRTLARLVRDVISVAPLASLVRRPPCRPEGVSALVRVAGDEEWIEPCLRSIADFADEVIMLDNGASADALERWAGIARQLAPRARRVECLGRDLPEVANHGLAQSRFRWVFLWDADFVARTEGPASIGRLKAFLARLDPRRYYVVHVRAIELAGDLRHRFPDVRERYDPHVFTASGPARYVWRARTIPPDRAPLSYRPLRERHPAHFKVRYDTLTTPKYYRVLRWDEACLFHVNVKNARRTLLRHFWLEWLRSDRALGLEAYARQRVREQWGLDDLEAAAERFMAEYCRALERVDEAAIGPYPRALVPHLESPAYRVLYRDGQIVGRTESALAPRHSPC